MDDSFNLYKKNNDNDSNKKSVIHKFLFNILIKSLIVIALFLGSLIYIRQSSNNKKKLKKIVYNNNLSFAKIYNVYNKYLGDVIPFKGMFKNNTKLVSNEKLIYKSIKKEGEGYILKVDENYLLFSLRSGIVIKTTKDKKRGNTITIQDKEGLNITYGYLNDVKVKLYDYVKKGEIISGIKKDSIYLLIEKDGKYLSYEKYL